MDEVINKQIAHTLRRLRTEARLTQVQLAERMGRPQSYVSKVETAFRTLHASDLFFYAQALDMQPNELFCLICDSVETYCDSSF